MFTLSDIKTPSYVFDIGVFHNRVKKLKKHLEIRLNYVIQ